MIVRARAPLRLSFGGGGTELSPYMDQFGGMVLNATINLHVHTTLRPNHAGAGIDFCAADQDRRLTLAEAGEVPTDRGLPIHCGVHNWIVRQFNGGRPLPLCITTYSEAPTGSGLGASSTLTVSLIKAYDEYLNLALGEYDVARMAYRIERDVLGFAGGRQDQYAAAFGGVNLIEFHTNDQVIVNPLRVRNWIVSELEAQLVLFYTGVSRESGTIIESQTRRMRENDADIMARMHRIKAYASAMKEHLLKGDLRALAEDLDGSWREKRGTADRVSSPAIDQVYEQVRDLGVHGGKISGAGSGGFMMLICDPERRHGIERYLRDRAGGQVFPAKFIKVGAESWRLRDQPFA
jgi:D-glycero-alpha-D-manno-heptose-7-phosphate kinase